MKKRVTGLIIAGIILAIVGISLLVVVGARDGMVKGNGYMFYKKIIGNGTSVEKTIEIGNASQIKLSLPSYSKDDKSNVAEIVFDKNIENIVVKSDANILDNIVSNKEGNTLAVSFGEKRIQARPSKNFTIYLPDTQKEIILEHGYKIVKGSDKIANYKNLTVRGALEGELAFDDLETPKGAKIDVSGAIGDFKISGTTQLIKLIIKGAGEIDLKGKTDNLEIDISGAGEINAFDLLAKKAYLKVAGAGDAKVNVVETLNIKISGAASVKYKGNASVTVEGTGNVKKVD